MPDAPDHVELPVTVETRKMAIDLPDNVAGMLLKEGSESHQALMADIRHNGAAVHSLLRFSAARSFDQLDTLESRANSGVMATPIASPTTQAGTTGP